MNPLNNDLGYKTLTECVMEYLRKQLNCGVYKPDEEIDINSLSKMLGVSRTPVREALLQLAKEGFVEAITRRGFRIKRLTLKDISDIYQVIGTLEAEASKMAVDKIKPSTISLLEKLYVEMAKALEINDFNTYLDLNRQTHSTIMGYCDNPVLLNTVRQLKEKLYEFPRILNNIPEWEKEMMLDHSRMIELLKNKSKKSLADLIQNVHWSFSRNYPYLKKYYRLK